MKPEMLALDHETVARRVGLVLVVIGLLWPWLGRFGLGRLPGDIVIERGEFRFYFPIMTASSSPGSCR